MRATAALSAAGKSVQTNVVRKGSPAAETVDSPCAARVGFSRPSKTGPGLENADGVPAAVPWPTDPAVMRFFALAGVPTETGGGQNCPPLPAEVTSSRSG